MNDDPNALARVWVDVVAELTSDDPGSNLPALSSKQKAFVRLVRPLTLALVLHSSRFHRHLLKRRSSAIYASRSCRHSDATSAARSRDSVSASHSKTMPTHPPNRSRSARAAVSSSRSTHRAHTVGADSPKATENLRTPRLPRPKKSTTTAKHSRAFTNRGRRTSRSRPLLLLLRGPAPTASMRSTPFDTFVIDRPTDSLMPLPSRSRRRRRVRTTPCSSGSFGPGQDAPSSCGRPLRTATVPRHAGQVRLDRRIHQRLHQQSS